MGVTSRPSQEEGPKEPNWSLVKERSLLPQTCGISSVLGVAVATQCLLNKKLHPQQGFKALSSSPFPQQKQQHILSQQMVSKGCRVGGGHQEDGPAVTCELDAGNLWLLSCSHILRMYIPLAFPASRSCPKDSLEIVIRCWDHLNSICDSTQLRPLYKRLRFWWTGVEIYSSCS